MLHCQILPPPPIVADTILDVALISYNRPESAFKFEVCSDEPQYELLQLLAHSAEQVIAALSTNSSPEAVIYSLPL